MFDSREFEYADVKVFMLGKELTGLRGLTYKKTQDKEVVFGAGNEGRAIQRGNKKYEGQLMVLKSEFDLLNAAAVAAGYEDILDVPGNKIDIVVVYRKSDALKTSTARILNVEFTEYEDGLKTEEKFKEVTLPFLALKVKPY